MTAQLLTSLNLPMMGSSAAMSFRRNGLVEETTPTAGHVNFWVARQQQNDLGGNHKRRSIQIPA